MKMMMKVKVKVKMKMKAKEKKTMRKQNFFNQTGDVKKQKAFRLLFMHKKQLF